MQNEPSEEFMSRLDRDSQYRMCALNNAIRRAGQDGGIEGSIDVYALAEGYYAWLKGTLDTTKPTEELPSRKEKA